MSRKISVGGALTPIQKQQYTQFLQRTLLIGNYCFYLIILEAINQLVLGGITNTIILK
jgi:hypothetical protein